MLGLFGLLNLGARSLQVQQQGSEVTGQNLANVNNPAYSRQQLLVADSISILTSQGYEGTGVDSISIQQVRDALLDGQITSETSITSALNAEQSALQNAQANLGEQITSSSSTGSGSQYAIAQGLSDLFNAFQSLSSDPSSLAKRSVVIQKAQALASQFNQVATNLSNLRNGLNNSISKDVASANQDLTDIAQLNQQIMQATASGKTANDLVDERQAKLEDLAGKLNFTSTTDSTGAVNISIGGNSIVSGAKVVTPLQTYDAGNGQVLVSTVNGNTPLTITGGSIGGNITARDTTLSSLQSDIGHLATQVINQVNSVYSAGYDLNGNTGQSFFTGTSADTIAVNAGLVTDPSTFQAASAPGSAGNNGVVLALGQLGSNTIAGLGNQTFTGSYANTIANFGQALSNVNDQVANQGSVATMLQAQRSSVSGVNLDEEMTNLMQYQKAYQASAELITTVNQMLETVVSMKTV